VTSEPPVVLSSHRPPRSGPYAARYAGVATGMAVSELRALFAMTAHPEIISLAGGMTDVASLPLDAIGEMVGGLMADRGAQAHYCAAQGDVALRERICDVMALEGIRVHPDEIVITSGSEQGLDLLARIVIDRTDVVLAEAPSYVGALNAFAACQADVVHVAMDDDGLIPAALDEAIAQVARSGRRAKILYTVPNFHNPAGVTLAAGRRTEILGICDRAGLTVVEDNPYGLLRFDGRLMRAMRADDPGVVYLGTFSKTFAPGMHVGWVAAPAAITAKLVRAMEPASVSGSSRTQLTVREYLTTQPWREHLQAFRRLYAERRDVAVDAMARLLPEGCGWTMPAGGFFTWLRLPDGVDSAAMLPWAIAAGVAYVPGTSFYADGSGTQFARLCYSSLDRDSLCEGIRRLALAIENIPR
jgi:2-aminoadipate transaminase